MRTWLEARRRKLRARQRKKAAERRVCEAFERSRGFVPMGSRVLRVGEEQSIVRVLYLTDHLPPDRAWFTVSDDGLAVRELAFDEVREFEKEPWR